MRNLFVKKVDCGNEILIISVVLLKLTGCSNAPDIMSSEIKTYKLLKQSISTKQNSEDFIDVRSLIDRKYIDKAKVPLLYVKLETGQNGLAIQVAALKPYGLELTVQRLL